MASQRKVDIWETQVKEAISKVVHVAQATSKVVVVLVLGYGDFAVDSDKSCGSLKVFRASR
jgi:hypothetical protein